ncbi:hypothetical protein TTHERM_00609440 (macronuclear) [Tetrahymena thermophila SB210]|uniref:Uncharacterized protein n=1 Tax=Tetrahymena thermophila (strain SB210) TaxID=312017 RepID=Q22YE5_TETTS|nr:hypothetical protein TTHERM_00609440 [Tetrahymena thermophila SB210]EAR90340.2 hypothetical protein TTHERM_00609440 [Tetrahymena thermophila SB210]|eukprot:XP_001010585.2 hypothetical protein TTHERM_00609440 [Tetrahymena thermophila SB210]
MVILLIDSQISIKFIHTSIYRSILGHDQPSPYLKLFPYFLPISFLFSWKWEMELENSLSNQIVGIIQEERKKIETIYLICFSFNEKAIVDEVIILQANVLLIQAEQERQDLIPIIYRLLTRMIFNMEMELSQDIYELNLLLTASILSSSENLKHKFVFASLDYFEKMLEKVKSMGIKQPGLSIQYDIFIWKMMNKGIPYLPMNKEALRAIADGFKMKITFDSNQSKIRKNNKYMLQGSVPNGLNKQHQIFSLEINCQNNSQIKK